jgi:hypothetical protein
MSCLLLLALVGAGCDDGSATNTCNQSNATFELTLADDTLTPAALTACRDQRVTLTITVEQTGTLYIEGYANQQLAVTSGDTAVFDFTASQAGQFPVKLRAEGAEIEVGTFTVQSP